MGNRRRRGDCRLASCIRFVVWLTLPLFSQAGAAEPQGLLPNPDFEAGLSGWRFRPGDASQTALTAAADRGQVLELRPNGRLLGVETEPLAVGRDVNPEAAYRVAAQLKYDALQKGVFAFSMYCFDARGKSLQQIVFASRNTQAAPHDWRPIRGEFGPGTRNPLPGGTATVVLRFSFHEGSGDCRGAVAVDDVRLEPFTPRPDGWPNEIVAEIGDLGVRLERRSFWTLYRIDYRGTRLGLDRWGSHYGSVANFPGVGFIGSGHTEHEEEELLALKLEIDGQPVEKPGPTLRGSSLRLEKKSRIRTLTLDSEILVGDGRILEQVRLWADRPTPVTLVYHFMHPWTQTATEYLAELADGTRVAGTFDGGGSQRIDKPTRWSAIYDGPTAQGAVTIVLETPPADDWRTRYWDVDRYRKHYLATFLGKTIPPDQEFRYRVTTVPFAAPPADWKQAATRHADLVVRHDSTDDEHSGRGDLDRPRPNLKP